MDTFNWQVKYNFTYSIQIKIINILRFMHEIELQI